ncbi:hypothetical protein [Paraliomyxa miuraensis]|uniref:hypothetical protein n=1 Tax=Paraliomyxa miuraensis TaxID=376150 RepID=UPI002250C723|nr:hypothetical protein [Paraliomyxa miuraensis]MCX4242251.1 hypothetical protein [Paraliomyxa miuraensis]
MAHEDLGVKSEKHVPGCVTRHIATYIEGNTCSHRWQAAKKARAETRINYVRPNEMAQLRWNATQDNLAKIARYKSEGKTGGVKRTYGGKQSFTLKPFSTMWWPWPNNAHHIIPRSTLAGTLEQIAKAAEPNENRMFEVMVQGLLGEEYNLNDEPNMIMLPLQDPDAVAMALPRHLDGSGAGAMNHPDYSLAVEGEVKTKLEPKYQSLASAIKANKHQGDDKAPACRKTLEGISNRTYDAIISKAAAAHAAGQADVTLDSIGPSLYQ